MNKEKSFEKTQMKAFKESISSASNKALADIITNICDILCASGFKKPETKHKVQTILRNPRVNKTTRPAYERLCSLVASDTTLMPLIKCVAI